MIVSPVRVTLPVFVTVFVKSTSTPTASKVVMFAVFWMSMAARLGACTSVEALA